MIVNNIGTNKAIIIGIEQRKIRRVNKCLKYLFSRSLLRERNEMV